MITSFFKYTKEALVSRWINSKIRDYGSVSSLKIDTNRQMVRINVLLKGEDTDLALTIENYKILNEQDGTYFYIEKIISSREWVNILINNYLETILPENRIKLPNRIVKSIVKMLL